MTQTIEVESIKRLDVKPGETLVVTLPESAEPRDMQAIRIAMEGHVPDGVRLLIVSHSVELGVISAEQ